MKQFFSSTLIVALLMIGISERSTACSSAIIIGKATPDGRPLMWKQMDGPSTITHRITYVKGAKYAYIGVARSCKDKNSTIWAGTNSAGFCIMNTSSPNLEEKGGNGNPGIVMRKALESCATIEDFEELLNNMKKPMGLHTNFGVIDANGGAAYYETGNYSYTKYDANDPEVAPNNYLIRTNYSFSGRTDEGGGYIRYDNAKYLFENHPTQKFTPEWIFSSVARYYYHSLLNVDLHHELPNYAIDLDYIPRLTSKGSFVFQGVKKGERAEHTTMWIVFGFPPVGIVVPSWVAGGEHLPEVVTKVDHNERTPLWNKVLTLQHKIFPIKRGNGEKYMHFSLLYNAKGDGIIQKLQPIEKEIFTETYKKIDEWNTKSWDAKKIQEYYKYLNDKIVKAYKDLFDL